MLVEHIEARQGQRQGQEMTPAGRGIAEAGQEVQAPEPMAQDAASSTDSGS